MCGIKIGEKDLSYIAGFLDGDGSILMNTSLQPNGKRCLIPRVQIANTDLQVIKWMRGKIGGNIRTRWFPRKSNHKSAYYLEISTRRGVLNFLTLINKLLKVKRRQALLVMKWCICREKTIKRHGSWHTPYTKREMNMYKKLKKLNFRGRE